MQLLAPHTFTVPIFSDSPTPDLIGSGVFVVTAGVGFIITAAHTFEPFIEPKSRMISREFGLGFAQGEVLLRGAFMMLTASTLANEGDSENAEFVDAVDIALIPLDEEQSKKLNGVFNAYNLDDGRHLLAGDMFIVAGWPCSQNKWRPEKEFKLRGLSFACVDVDLEARPDAVTEFREGRPDIHFALQFSRTSDYGNEEGKKVWLPLLNGVSGGGVWAGLAEKEGEAECVISLVGIFIAHAPEKNLALVVRIEHVGGALAKFFHRFPPPEPVMEEEIIVENNLFFEVVRTRR